MPPPWMFTSEMPWIEAMPVMGWPVRLPLRCSGAPIIVPGAAGFRLFLIRMGMRFSTAGIIV